MAQAEVIREFLVQLGFKTDEKALKNFTGGVEQATKSVVKLVGAISGAALTVGAGVSAFASNLERLYFATQRTGSSAENLRAFSKAAQNLGASSEEAMASVEALARLMRSNPGSEGFIRSLGVDTRDANGNLRESVDIMVDLGKKLSEMPFYLAKLRAEQLGISENVLLALTSGKFAQEYETSRKRLENSGLAKATQDAHRFMEGLRELQTYVESFAVQVADALMQSLGVPMDKFADWFVVNGPIIAKRVADFTISFMKLAEKVIPAISWLVDKLMSADEATDGWSTKILALVAALNLLGGAALIGGIMSLAGAFAKLATGIASAAGAAAAGSGAAAGGAAAGGAAAAGGGASLVSRVLPWLGRLSTFFSLMTYSGGLNEGEDEELRRRREAAGQPGTMPESPRGIRNNNPGNINFAGQRGATLEGGKNGRFARFKTPEEGIEALAFQLELYARRGLTTIDQIVKTYAPAKDNNNVKAYIASLSNRMGVGATDQLNLSDPAVLERLMSGIIQHENGQNPYSAGMIHQGALSGMQRAGVTVQQTTNITVNGGGDPAAAGRAVAGEQTRVNQNLTRNLSTAIQ